MSVKVITVGREFGSGGRSVGKAVAAALGWDYYDQELVRHVAEKTGFAERYIEETGEYSASKSRLAYAFSSVGSPEVMNGLSASDYLWTVQRKVILDLAEKGNCVIVGRCADVILKDYHPLNLFVYANAESKIQRCIDRAPEGEHLSRNDIARRMKQVDKNRAQYRQMFADSKWGAKETYHLCVNTSGHQIKDLIPGLAAFVRCWYGEK